MNVLDAVYELMKHFPGFLFVDTFIFNDVVEKLALLHKLHNQKQLFGGLNDLIQLDEIWMSNKFENMNFACDSFDVGDFADFIFFQEFDCYFLVRMFVYGQPHFSECAFA